MDLFVINRYWGGVNYVPDVHAEERGQIENLLSKIEERKKQRLREATSVTVESDKCTKENATETKLTPKVKRRKPKISDQLRDLIEDSQVDNSQVAIDDISSTNVEQHIDTPTSNAIADGSSGKNSTLNFTVIGSDAFHNIPKANLKLPSWLENPVVIPVDLTKKENSSRNNHIHLNPRVIQRLKEHGITNFFPVQEKVIPWLLNSNSRCLYHWPRDICVSAPTGSGKTLAFVLPIIEAIIGRIIPAIRVLVVLPVAELAKQVGAVFHQYCCGTGLKVTVAVGGGTSFSKEHNLLVTTNELVGCQTDIMVTTPGRLVAHLRAGSGYSAVRIFSSSPAVSASSISLGHLQFLVVDEADRVAEGSQNDWLSHLMHHLEYQVGLDSSLLPLSVSTIRKFHRCPRRPPQKLLFSATLSQDPEKLCALSLFQPKLFSTAPHRKEEMLGKEVGKGINKMYVTPMELLEEYVVASGGESEKPLVLLWLLQQRLRVEGSLRKALVFASSRQSATRLALLLSLVSWEHSSPITSSHLSADLVLRDREKILQGFAAGSIDVLVCSDALARGVDIPLVDLVVSYDIPRHLKNHIHRIGRTGRAGRSGCAVTILTPAQLNSFSLMIYGDQSMSSAREIILDTNSLTNLRDRYERALNQMQRTLKEERSKLMLVSRKRKRKEGKWKQPSAEGAV